MPRVTCPATAPPAASASVSYWLASTTNVSKAIMCSLVTEAYPVHLAEAGYAGPCGSRSAEGGAGYRTKVH